jgi:hypothetical protein
MLRPESFGSPFIGVLCARSPSSPRARVGPQRKTKRVGPEQKAKRGKGNDRWGRGGASGWDSIVGKNNFAYGPRETWAGRADSFGAGLEH